MNLKIGSETRLCSAVVNQCVKDACMSPSITKSKPPAIRPAAKEAIRELFNGRLDGYIYFAGIMPNRFKNTLIEFMYTSKEPDIYGLYNEQRRECFRWNCKQVLDNKNVHLPKQFVQKMGETYQ